MSEARQCHKCLEHHKQCKCEQPSAASAGYRDLSLSNDDLNLIRQWFNAVMDINPAYLTRADYQLAIRICEATSQPACEKMQERSR